jgi:hypothetical protein
MHKSCLWRKWPICADEVLINSKHVPMLLFFQNKKKMSCFFPLLKFGPVLAVTKRIPDQFFDRKFFSVFFALKADGEYFSKLEFFKKTLLHYK